MEPINNADRIALILRQKLLERAKSQGSSGSSRSGQSASQRSSLAALAATAGVDDRQFRRTVIQSILAQQFGRELLNDAQFQQLVSQVTEAIEADTEARALLDQAITELQTR